MELDHYSWMLVYLAAGSQMLAQLSRNQITLRLLLLLGTALYMVFYFAQPAGPLWGAIHSNAANATAGIIGLFLVLRSRYFTFLTPRMKQIATSLPGLEPGDLRRLLKTGEIVTAERDVTLTRENERLDYICFIHSGDVEIRKGDASFLSGAGVFVGEISYLTGSRASATATLRAGGKMVRWRQADLRRLMRRKPMLEKSFHALLSHDMARKVANSISCEPPPAPAI